VRDQEFAVLRVQGDWSQRGGRYRVVHDVTVERSSLTRSDAVDLVRRGEAAAAAPAMPMQLVEPAQDGEPPPLATAKGPGMIEWGVRAVGADTSPYSGKDVVVAILDSGIDKEHPSIKGFVDIEDYNFSTDLTTDDLTGHGTHCAGIIFGRDFGGTRIGIARGVTRAFNVKVLGAQGVETTRLAEAIDWSIHAGANVISMSVGVDFTGYREQLVQSGLPDRLATSRALEDYVANVNLFASLVAYNLQRAAQSAANFVLVAAAGNDSHMELHPDYKVGLGPPAASKGIVSVAALGPGGDDGLVLAPFSNVRARIGAPGVNIVSAKPGGGFKRMSGTSMAAPHVAGVAALWMQRLKAETGGHVDNDMLVGRVSLGTRQGLSPSVSAADVIGGLVRAPQA
jgi:subtilisin family serine protease